MTAAEELARASDDCTDVIRQFARLLSSYNEEDINAGGGQAAIRDCIKEHTRIRTALRFLQDVIDDLCYRHPELDDQRLRQVTTDVVHSEEFFDVLWRQQVARLQRGEKTNGRERPVPVHHLVAYIRCMSRSLLSHFHIDSEELAL